MGIHSALGLCKMKCCILLSAGRTNLQSWCDKSIQSTASADGANDCSALPVLDSGPTSVTQQSAMPVADSGLDVASVAASLTSEQAADNCNPVQSTMHVGTFYGSRYSRRPTAIKPSRYR